MSHTDCIACSGIGMQADDEGWQYSCSICDGSGKMQADKETKVLDVDDNNRLLD